MKHGKCVQDRSARRQEIDQLVRQGQGRARIVAGVKLFTDKTASQRKLIELQKHSDQRAVGMRTAETEQLALPIRELVQRYVDSLRSQNLDPSHIRITQWSLMRLIDAAKWQRYSDIFPSTVERVLPALAQTAGYRNAFIKRLKAFVHWALPDNWPDPLKKLNRVNEKGALRNHQRRAASAAEAAAFFKHWPSLPADRHLCYALAMLNGLRRGEMKRDDGSCLRWRQLHLDATIPFIELKQKMGAGKDYIPLHPYVVWLLSERMRGMPNAPVVAAVPDVSTLEKDLGKVGIELIDDQKERLDFHALRHTFVTNLDRNGCSRATKKKLMRHAHEDVTDKYSHAELAEMLAALMGCRRRSRCRNRRSRPARMTRR